MADLAPAFLLTGDDDAKIDAALTRLRSRAEREGGPGALESFSPGMADAAPDLDGLLAAIPALSLVAAKRYLLADRVDRLSAKELNSLAQAVERLPQDLTVVLVARTDAGSRAAKAKAAALKELDSAVKEAGGEGSPTRPRRHATCPVAWSPRPRARLPPGRGRGALRGGWGRGPCAS